MKRNRPIAIAPRETPEQRKRRVLRLQQEVENGTYRPDLHAVALRLFRELHFGLSWH